MSSSLGWQAMPCALTAVLHVLRWSTPLCASFNCTAWEAAPPLCDAHQPQIERLRRLLPQQVGVFASLAGRSQWGREHVRQRVPLGAGWHSLFSAEDGLHYPSTDLVIARCNEPVSSWLPELLVHFPAHVRLRVFLYETCSSMSTGEGTIGRPRYASSPWAYWFDVPVVRRAVENRGFESAVYLRHMLWSLEAGDLAERTLFMQAGWREHTRRFLGCDFLERHVAALPFASYGRRYSTMEGNGCWDLCMSHHVWAVILPEHDPIRSATASYAIFHAARHRITATGPEKLRLALAAATMESPELRARLCGPTLPSCPGRGCRVRLRRESGFADSRLYCNDSGKLAGIGLELGWHLLLGEEEALPLEHAPLSEVSSAFSPSRNGSWRPPLQPPCPAGGPWTGRNNTLMMTRLKRVLLRVLGSAARLHSDPAHSTLGPPVHSRLRFHLRGRTRKRAPKGGAALALAGRSATLARWEQEEQSLLWTATGWDRPAGEPEESIRVPTQASTTSGELSKVRECCRWVGATERQPRRDCGAADAPEHGWWRALPRNRSRHALRIQMNHGSAGFFAYVLFAINQIAFARKHGIGAHVDYGACTVNGRDHYASGGANLYHSPAHGANMWEQYFQPVSDVVPGAGHVLHALPSKALWKLHQRGDDSVFAYYYGVHSAKRGYDEAWYRSMRLRAHGLLKHVSLKPHVQDAVDDFWRRELAARWPVLGLHVRGTDKDPAIGGSIVPPRSYAPHIDSYLASHPNATLFVATDSPAALQWMRQRYGARVVAREALRSEGNAFLDTRLRDNYRKGLDVLLDALLLSRCDFLLKSSSAVGEFAIYWSPRLHERSIDLQYEPISAVTRPSFAGQTGRGSEDSLCVENADFMLRELEHLPMAGQTSSSAKRVTGGASWPSRSDLFSLLARVQSSGAGCGHGEAATTTLLPAGFFSTLHGVLKPLAHAVRSGTALRTPSLAAFTGPSCRARDLSCFFERMEGELCGSGAQHNHLDLEDEGFVRDESFSLQGPKLIPVAFRSRGWFWYTSQLLSWVMRPNAALAADIKAALEASRLGAALRRGPVIGVHVRHGDACLARERRRMGRTCYSLERHLARVRGYARAHGIWTVYLATDSEKVLDEARRSTEFQFLWLPNVTRQRATPARIIDRTVRRRVATGETHLSAREAWQATVDVMLLAECALLVGQMTSTLFRTAISLRAAACDCVMPFASLDAPFCSDYGVRSGVVRAGAGAGANRSFWC